MNIVNKSIRFFFFSSSIFVFIILFIMTACSPRANDQSRESAPFASENQSTLTSQQERQIEQLLTIGRFDGMDLGPVLKDLIEQRHDIHESPEIHISDTDELIEQLNAMGYLAGSYQASHESGVTINIIDKVYPGPSLYTSGHALEAILIDMQGHELHKWSCSYEASFPERKIPQQEDWLPNWRYAYCYENGDLLAIVEGQGLIKLDRNSNILWVLDERAHHDLQVMESGHIFVLTRKAHMAPRINEMRPILEDFITLIDEEGNIIKQVSLLEAYERSKFRDILFGKLRSDGDLMHANTIEYFDGALESLSPLFKRGNMLISLKSTCSLAIIDFNEEVVVWHKDGPWINQHKPTLLPNGKMMLFNNNRFGGASSVLVFEPLAEKVDILWEYKGNPPESFYTPDCGASQPLPNGNILVTESERGRAFEITKDKETVWRFVSPYRTKQDSNQVAYIYEMIRLNSDFPLDWTYQNRSDWPLKWKK